MVESSRLETTASLCLRRLSPCSNKSSSRLESGIRGARPATCVSRGETAIRARLGDADGAARVERESRSLIPAECLSFVRSFARASKRSARSGECGVTILMRLPGNTGTVRFRSACPPPNLSKTVTIYASTLVGEIQGIGGCGRIGLRDDLIRFRGARYRVAPNSFGRLSFKYSCGHSNLRLHRYR